MSVVRPQLLSSLAFWIGAAAVIVAVLAVYSPSLNYPFILDDNRFIGDPRVQLPGQILNYFTNAAWAQFAGGPTSFYRPLFVVWIRLNYILNEMSPWGWHFASVLKHLAVTVLLGILVWKLLRDRVAVLIAVALFALHPAHTESVAWVSVPDPLMAVLVLGSILLYLKSVQASLSWLTLSALLYLAALLVKETAIVTLLILFAVGLTAPATSFQARVMGASRSMLLFVAATAVYFLLRMHALGSRIVVSTQNMPWTTVVLSWPATLWFYLKVLFWPVQLRAFGDPTRADTFSVNGVLLPALGVCCVAFLLAFGLYWFSRKAPRAAGVQGALLLGALLLVLPLVPALNLNGLNPDDYLHGRYAYLSTAGLMLLIANAWHVLSRDRQGAFASLLPAAVVAIAFAGLTASQEPAWASERAVFEAGHQAAPRNVFVDRNLVRSHVQEALGWDVGGRCKEALPVFENAIQRYPEDWYGWAGLGDCLDQLNNLPRAEQALHRAADLAHQPQVTQRWEEVKEKLANR